MKDDNSNHKVVHFVTLLFEYGLYEYFRLCVYFFMISDLISLNIHDERYTQVRYGNTIFIAIPTYIRTYNCRMSVSTWRCLILKWK